MTFDRLVIIFIVRFDMFIEKYGPVLAVFVITAIAALIVIALINKFER